MLISSLTDTISTLLLNVISSSPDPSHYYYYYCTMYQMSLSTLTLNHYQHAILNRYRITISYK